MQKKIFSICAEKKSCVGEKSGVCWGYFLILIFFLQVSNVRGQSLRLRHTKQFH